MPITPFQKRIFKLLANNRSESSYVAGACVLNRDDTSPRFSKDIDLFHDSAVNVQQSYLTDAKTLSDAGFSISQSKIFPSFVQATVSFENEAMKLEWVADSDFRFFPLERDEDWGARLSLWDAATNKVLAGVGREVTRDIIDLVYLHQTQLALGALIWAAVGKDDGYTPSLICDQLRRHSKIFQKDIDKLELVRPIDSVHLKQLWLSMIDSAERYCEKLSSKDIGCFFLDPKTDQPFAPALPLDDDIPRHFGSPKGAWPHPADEQRPLPLPTPLDLGKRSES